MKKIIKYGFSCLLIMNLTSVLAQTELHEAKITGNISLGQQEVTAIHDLETDCIYKSEPHKKGLFVQGELVQLQFKAEKEQVEVIKPTLPEVVLVHRNECKKIAPTPFINFCSPLSVNRINVVNDMLHFETLQAYENAIEYINCALKYDISPLEIWNTLGITYNSLYSEAQKLNPQGVSSSIDYADEYLVSLGIEDDVLALLLSPTMQVRISNNIFKLDIINETVEVTSVVSTSNAGGNTAQTPTPPVVRIISTNDDVLDIVNGIGQQGLKTNHSCRKTHSVQTFCNDHLEYKLKYTKAGIYFSIVAKIKSTQGRDLNIYYIDKDADNEHKENWYLKKGNNQNKVYVKDDEVRTDKQGASSPLYRGFRGLKDFQTYVRFSAGGDNNNCSGDLDYLVIHCHH